MTITATEAFTQMLAVLEQLGFVGDEAMDKLDEAITLVVEDPRSDEEDA